LSGPRSEVVEGPGRSTGSGRVASRAGAAVAGAVAALALAAGVGAAAGVFYVWGLGPALVGLAAGAGVGFALLTLEGAVPPGAWRLAALGVALGWVALQVADDLRFRAAFREDRVAASFEDSGAPPEAVLEEGDEAFYGRGADEALEAQVVAETGHGGFVGRWLFRAREGVRLFGSWRHGRGLPVGLPGAVVASVLELLLGLYAARALLGRIGRSVLAEGEAAG